MRTLSVTSYPTRSRSSTPSTSFASGHRSSTRSAAASSKTPSATEGTSTTRSIRSAACSDRHGVEHLSERQQAKLTRCLEAGDPDGEVNLAWQCYQQLRPSTTPPPPKVGGSRRR